MFIKCPKCGCTKIEETLVDATVYSEILSVSEDGQVEYGSFRNEDGEVSNYSCWNCDYVFEDEDGACITDIESLVALYSKQC